MNKIEALENFGGCLDSVDSLLMALNMPIPDTIHVKALKEALPDLHERLKRVYLSLGGENV